MHTAILDNSKINVSHDVKNLASKVKFVGADEPAFPISIRFAESISTLKALEGLTIVDLIQRNIIQPLIKLLSTLISLKVFLFLQM